MRHVERLFLVVVLVMCWSVALHASEDPLPSWNDTPTKKAIVNFVETVTNPQSLDFVEPSDRVATFDNDGTLWTEQPLMAQLAFALDQIRKLAPQHPEWKTTEPFMTALQKDLDARALAKNKGMVQLLMVTDSGMTTDQFAKSVLEWLKTARQPRFGKPYTECVYQPMLELLKYLRTNGFKTFIVSGSAMDFMRPWSGRVYGIPPNQVIGSYVKTRFEIKDGKPVLLRLPELLFLDDKGGKPEAIHRFIGQQPIAAFGNSDGDLQMMRWTSRRPGKSFCLLVHHTDAKREYAYDRDSPLGRLNKALDEARKRNWTVVDMKKDWNRVFPFDSEN